MQSSNGVAIDNLGKFFGSLEAVRGISLQIKEGETFGLLGPNGAGKTTTLSMLSTLLTPSYGDAHIFGTSLSRDVRSVRRLVGIAPQEISLYPNLTGEENIYFFGRLHGLRGAALARQANEMLDLVGLNPRRHDRVGVYSGGMRRRLNLACSLVHSPRLVLLDEPTLGVDPQSRENILRGIQDIAARGTTVLYTTHYMEEAERLCDRIAIMDEGRVIEIGTLEELLHIVGIGEVVEIHGPPMATDGMVRESVPDVTKVETNDQITRIFVKSAARALGPIATVIGGAGGNVDGLEIYPVNLERVFMHLTGKHLRD
jgi:ABC-2 type transport system ATP-binding protein